MSKKLGGGLTVEAVILCDEIRTEISNKHSLMGVSVGAMNVASFPSAIKLAAYVDIVGEKKTDETLEVRWMFNGIQQVASSAAISVTPPGHVAIVMPPAPIMMPAPGELTLEYRLKDQKWVEIHKTSITLPD